MHEMDMYKWGILGLCELRLKQSGEITTDKGHRVYYSGRGEKHEQGPGFLAHKGLIVKTAIGCRPISSRLMSLSYELLSKQHRKKKYWVIDEILYCCDQRRDLKKKRGEL